MKTKITVFAFNPAARQVVFLDYPAIGISLDSVLLITNTTDNIIIYNFADSALGGSVSGNVLTLDYDTSSMSSTDALQIYYDDVEKDISDNERVFGSQHLDDGTGSLNSAVKKYAESPLVFTTLAGINQEIGINCAGYATVIADMNAAFSGNMVFEAKLMSGVWIGIGGSYVSTTGYIGNFTSTVSPVRFSVSGYSAFRIRISTYTSGIVPIVLKATTAPFIVQQVGSVGTFPTQDTNIPQLLGASGAVPTALNGAALVRPWQDPLPIAQPNAAISATYPNNFLSKWPQYYSRLRVEAGGDQRLPLAQDAGTNILKVIDNDNFELLEAILLELKIQTLMMAEAFNVNPSTNLTNI